MSDQGFIGVHSRSYQPEFWTAESRGRFISEDEELIV
jgi:hypothetical protein